MKKILAMTMALGMVLVFSACGSKSSSNKGGGTQPDTTQPVTTITSGPWNPSSSTEASFAFTCNKIPCTFACQLDDSDYAACTSPKTYTGLIIGNHTFRVRSTDSLGNFDHSPPTYPWTIKDLWFATSTANAPSERTGASSVWTGTQLIVWGGVNLISGVEYYLASGGIYDPVTDVWTTTKTDGAPDGRIGHTAVWTGTDMIVWGGYKFDSFLVHGYYLSSGGKYTPATDSWMPTTSTDAPEERMLHTAVWATTGPSDPSPRMIVWGGLNNDGVNDHFLKSGGIYDPVMDQWTGISTIIRFTPAARAGHSAVWTGYAMIIWGGYNNTQGIEFNNGGIFHPGPLTWDQISIANPPSARDAHTAIWTGSEMIIWGGHAFNYAASGESFFNDGAKYRPSTDIWFPLSTTNAPSPRRMHTAVWTGNNMIVWGGNYYDVSTLTNYFYNTGGIYNLATNTWTATNESGAPSGRADHRAAWTGVYMLIWGGLSFDGSRVTYYNTGGRYAP